MGIQLQKLRNQSMILNETEGRSNFDSSSYQGELNQIAVQSFE